MFFFAFISIKTSWNNSGLSLYLVRSFEPNWATQKILKKAKNWQSSRWNYYYFKSQNTHFWIRRGFLLSTCSARWMKTWIWTENIVRTTIKVLSACYTWLLKSMANDNILLDFMWNFFCCPCSCYKIIKIIAKRRRSEPIFKIFRVINFQ